MAEYGHSWRRRSFWHRPEMVEPDYCSSVTVSGAASEECVQTLDTYSPALAQQIADRLQDAAERLKIGPFQSPTLLPD